MSLNPTTIWFIVAVTVVVAIFDIAQLVKNGRDATISVTLRVLAARYQIVGVAIGILIGHLFASQCGIPCHAVQNTPKGTFSNQASIPPDMYDTQKLP